MKQKESDNVLRIVSTPIGNLEDVSVRVLNFLKECEVIVCEDTRTTQSLLKLLCVENKDVRLISFHDHNQDSAIELATDLMNYKLTGLVSDAGSPILSDPGYPLVKEFIEQGGEVESLPGPSSVTVALEVSALPPLPFTFHGFVPRKKEARSKFLQSAPAGVTHILFESPQRVEGLLEDLSLLRPEAEVVAARELTKLYEQVIRFRAKDWPEIKSTFKAKGEFVVLFRCEGEGVLETASLGEVEKLATDYLKKPSLKAISRLIAEIKGEKVQEVYNQLSAKNTKN
jgi:16S rRNA (cytidine1402-2'-O)-methyltransferase